VLNPFQTGAWRRALALATGLLAAGLAGLASAADDGLRIEAPRIVAEKAHTSDLPELARTPKAAYMAYYTPGDSANQLRITDLATSGPGDLVYQLPAGGNKMSDLGFATAGETRYILWRPKFAKRKDMYFAKSDGPGQPFSEPQIINKDHNALLPIRLDAGSNGLVVAVWHDERRGKERDVYMNISRDGGKSFEPQDIWLSKDYDTAASPALLVEGQEIHTFFVAKTVQNKRPSKKERRAADKAAGKDAKADRRDKKDKRQERKDAKEKEKREPQIVDLYVVHRYSLDGGKTWQENRLAKTEPTSAADVLTPVRMNATGSGPGRLWLFYREGITGLKGFYTDDNGKNWKAGTLPKLKDGEYVVTVSAATARDSIFIAYTNTFPGEPTAKPDVYMLTGRDKGERWEAPRRLSTEPFRLTMSVSPEVAADPSGRVAVVWTDLRNIRANTYVSYSTDLGATYAPERVLEEPGRYNSRYAKLLSYGDGRYDVTFLRFADDRTRDAGMWATRFTLPAPKAAAK